MNNNKNIGFDKQEIEEPKDIIDNEIDINVEEKKQNIKNIKSDRELKKNTQINIIIILYLNIVATFALIYFNFFFNKKSYSEWFLSVLIGSQLIILPFSLLFIVAKHLFPNKDK